MQDNRILTSEELLNFIREVSSAKTVKDLEVSVAKLKVQTISTEEDTIQKQYSENNSIDGASIYDAEDLPLVQADLKEQRDEEVTRINEGTLEDLEPKTLERRINDPWGDLRRVVPGENN